MTSLKKPNFLLINVDQWPGSYMGCAGHPDVLTPTLDELSKVGVRFTNAYSATPVCIPARRELMTGACARVHGDRCFDETLEMPQFPTMAGVFAQSGYQTYAVGKLHVYPQRDRIGFDDVVLLEEGRHKGGMAQDDYERFLARKGYAGLEFMHGMCNNNYLARPWHLPEECHPTNWITYQMCETIKRRDPKRPAFWYLSYNHPHPPLAPLKDYLDMYSDCDMSIPYCGEWTSGRDLPSVYQFYRGIYDFVDNNRKVSLARKAFYALCTHIDHQIRLVIGTLREEGVLQNTVIAFVSDHGDMLGNQKMWGKNVFYEDSAKIPYLLIPCKGYEGLKPNTTDDRLVELRDIMPTFLEMAGIEIPKSVDGSSLIKEEKKDYIYGELWEDMRATRMIRWSDYKLIYCPANNIAQLFDIKNDPQELKDLSGESSYLEIRKHMESMLIQNLYGGDEKWAVNGNLVGRSEEDKKSSGEHAVLRNADLLLQRGLR